MRSFCLCAVSSRSVFVFKKFLISYEFPDKLHTWLEEVSIQQVSPFTKGDLRPARRECDDSRGWGHHEERHDDRYFDCDGHVDGASEHTPKERHRDLVVDKEMPDVLEKNVDIQVWTTKGLKLPTNEGAQERQGERQGEGLRQTRKRGRATWGFSE